MAGGGGGVAAARGSDPYAPRTTLPEMKRRSPALRVIADLGGAVWSQRRWWLLPVVVASLLIAAGLMMGSSPAAPFIYTFF